MNNNSNRYVLRILRFERFVLRTDEYVIWRNKGGNKLCGFKTILFYFSSLSCDPIRYDY